MYPPLSLRNKKSVLGVEGEVVQTIYTHVSKCKNNKIFKIQALGFGVPCVFLLISP
jgi:hypothetical protein